MTRFAISGFATVSKEIVSQMRLAVFTFAWVFLLLKLLCKMKKPGEYSDAQGT